MHSSNSSEKDYAWIEVSLKIVAEKEIAQSKLLFNIEFDW
jgi:hypothetical protein